MIDISSPKSKPVLLKKSLSTSSTSQINFPFTNMSIVQFVNTTEWCIRLRDEDTAECLICTLEPGEIKNMDTKKLSKHDKLHGTRNWSVAVLKNNKFVNIELKGSDISESSRIIFTTQVEIEEYGIRKGQDKKVLRVEGIREKWIDGCLRIKYLGSLMGNSMWWKKRSTAVLAREFNYRGRLPCRCN